MPVSGLVLTLSSQSKERRSVIAALVADRRVTLGPTPDDALLLPVVIESMTIDEQLELRDAFEALDGVLQVRLAFFDFSDIDDVAEEAGESARRPQHPKGGHRGPS